MTLNLLSCGVDAAANHTVCFSADGKAAGWQEFYESACRVKAALESMPGDRWALDLEDPYEFAFSLVGCWAAGKTAVVAPSHLIRSDRDVGIDAVITARSGANGSRPAVSVRDLPARTSDVAALDPNSGLVLYTSGSTSQPKEIERRLHNVEAELTSFEMLWGMPLADGRVYSTVSHRHVYGLLFRLLWPLVSARPFARFDLQYPEQLLGSVGSANMLVSSPALLKRIAHLQAKDGDWRLIFSSGGLLPLDAAHDAARVLGACPIEVFGSTETSGVASRQQMADTPARWTVLPTVDVRAGEDRFLEVKSAFSGQQGWYRMGDLVSLSQDGRFELLGRGDNIAKIEDKRVSLAEIEHLLLQHPKVVDVAAVALADSARQYVAVAIQLSPDGIEALARLGKRALSDELKNSMRSAIEPIALPRRIRFVDRIPVNTQGKRIQAQIKDLFV